MTMYNIHLELNERNIDEHRGSVVVDALKGYSAAVGPGVRGLMSVEITLPAENLLQALTTAVAVVERATGSTAVTAEVMTTEEYDIRNGLEPVPELMSVTEIANMYGMSRQGILKMITNGRFVTAASAGGTWVVSASEVHQKAPHTVDEGTAALQRGSAKK